jgi:hypothetical protein
VRGKTRKVYDAIGLWCRYPEEIEADFERFYPRLNLADWHRGARDEQGCLKLSSRKLLNLVMRLPDNSEFKKNAAAPFGRDGDWPELMHMIAATHNVLAEFRAQSAAFQLGDKAGDETKYSVFMSPSESKERAQEQAELEEFQEREFERLLSIFD